MTREKDFCECCGADKPREKKTEGSRLLLNQKLRALRSRQEELEEELGKVVRQIASTEKQLEEDG